MLAAVALVTRQPLQLDRSQQVIVLEQCGAGIVTTGMCCQNELRHVLLAYFEPRKKGSDLVKHVSGRNTLHSARGWSTCRRERIDEL